jgi:hypothetical protein
MTGNGSRGKRGRGKPKDFGVDFVQIRLTEEHRKELQKSHFGPDDLENALTRLVEAGQKISFVFGDRNDAVICTLTSPENPETKRKACVSSFGPDILSAVMVAWYKYAVLTDGGSWELYQVEEEERVFG